MEYILEVRCTTQLSLPFAVHQLHYNGLGLGGDQLVLVHLCLRVRYKVPDRRDQILQLLGSNDNIVGLIDGLTYSVLETKRIDSISLLETHRDPM